MTDKPLSPLEAAARAYATERVLARRRERVNRDELHPGDVSVDIEDEIAANLRLVEPEALQAAISAYMAAVPGEYGELAKEIRDLADWLDEPDETEEPFDRAAFSLWFNNRPGGVAHRAADAITALQAEVEELESELRAISE